MTKHYSCALLSEEFYAPDQTVVLRESNVTFVNDLRTALLAEFPLLNVTIMKNSLTTSGNLDDICSRFNQVIFIVSSESARLILLRYFFRYRLILKIHEGTVHLVMAGPGFTASQIRDFRMYLPHRPLRFLQKSLTSVDDLIKEVRCFMKSKSTKGGSLKLNLSKLDGVVGQLRRGPNPIEEHQWREKILQTQIVSSVGKNDIVALGEWNRRHFTEINISQSKNENQHFKEEEEESRKTISSLNIQPTRDDGMESNENVMPSLLSSYAQNTARQRKLFFGMNNQEEKEPNKVIQEKEKEEKMTEIKVMGVTTARDYRPMDTKLVNEEGLANDMEDNVFTLDARQQIISSESLSMEFFQNDKEDATMAADLSIEDVPLWSFQQIDTNVEVPPVPLGSVEEVSDHEVATDFCKEESPILIDFHLNDTNLDEDNENSSLDMKSYLNITKISWSDDFQQDEEENYNDETPFTLLTNQVAENVSVYKTEVTPVVPKYENDYEDSYPLNIRYRLDLDELREDNENSFNNYSSLTSESGKRKVQRSETKRNRIKKKSYSRLWLCSLLILFLFLFLLALLLVNFFLDISQ